MSSKPIPTNSAHDGDDEHRRGRVLITGGAGFIGSHLAIRLSESGWQVGVIDDLSTGTKENLEALNVAGIRAQDRFVADVSGTEVGDILAQWRPGIIAHLAAQSRVSTSVAHPVAGAVTNVVGTVNLLSAAVKAGVPKFIAASSGGAAYGSLPEDSDFHYEHADRRPLSPYGASKAAADLYLQAYSTSFGIACTSLLLGNVYGHRLDHQYSSDVISQTVRDLRAGRRPTVYGDGQQTRDFVHISDVVEAFRLACEGNATGSFNIGTGIETSISQVVGMVCAAMGRTANIAYAPPLPAEVRRVRLNIEAAARLLDWRPKVDLEAGIRDMRPFSDLTDSRRL